MAWDSDKSTDTGGSTTADEQLTATEWNNHVDDQKGHASRHESGGSDALTWANLADNDSTAVIIDTLTNRPAAGTADRLFVDLTNLRWQRDDGSQWVTIASTSGTVLDSGSLGTFSTGSDSQDFDINDVSTTESVGIGTVSVYPDGSQSLSADYAFNWTWGRYFDDSDGAVDLDVTVNWDTDPGSDITLAYDVYEGGGGGSGGGSYSDEDAQDAVGNNLGPYLSYDDATPEFNVAGDTNALDGAQGSDGQVWTSTGSGAQWEAASGGGGGGLTEGQTVTATDSPFSSSVNTEYVVDASGGDVEVVLPSSPSDHDTVEVTLVDSGNNSLTVSRNGNTIEAAASDDVISNDYVTKPYEWITEADAGAGTWVVVT